MAEMWRFPQHPLRNPGDLLPRGYIVGVVLKRGPSFVGVVQAADDCGLRVTQFDWNLTKWVHHSDRFFPWSSIEEIDVQAPTAQVEPAYWREWERIKEARGGGPARS